MHAHVCVCVFSHENLHRGTRHKNGKTQEGGVCVFSHTRCHTPFVRSFGSECESHLRHCDSHVIHSSGGVCDAS